MRQDILPAQQTTPALISASELAEMLQVSTRTLWRLRSAGKLIKPIKLGGSTRWRLDEVQAWIAAGCPAPDA
jgi:predicted DNA-binding transcriptional regulator AlpA